VVVRKKYTKSERLLEVQFYLSHREVTSCDPDSDRFVEILKRGALATYGEVKALRIKDFDVDAFYRDIGDLVDKRGWIKEPEKYKRPPVRVSIPPNIGRQRGRPMPEEHFWKFVQQSIDASKGSLDRQIAYLEESLATRSAREIVGFELALRDLIRKSHHYNVVAPLRVIDGTGTVMDDPYLYFRCRLILYGRDIFYTAIEDPNRLPHKLNSDIAAEDLLYVADNAFLRKFGQDTDKELPRSVGSNYSDYDLVGYPVLGTPWDETDFPERYAALLRLYNTD
jgi:hypothetical protein